MIPISTAQKRLQAAYDRTTPPGFLEKIGVHYYRRLAERAGLQEGPRPRIEDLPEDEILEQQARQITTDNALIALAVGAVTTMVTVWVEVEYFHTMDTWNYWVLQGSVTLVMLTLEFLTLFWTSLRSVHSLARLTGHDRVEGDPLLPGDDTVANILARAALEVPDPVVRYLGVDPLKYISKSKLLLIGLLYKAKVVLTSVAAKFLLRRALGRSSLRVYAPWVAVPITAFWDAWVIYKVACEARLRLFGHRLAQYLASEILTPQLFEHLSPLAREGAVRAVATTMVLTENYHPNMLMLLVQISAAVDILEDRRDYDDWEAFKTLLNQVSTKERHFLLDLVCIAAAFDGRLSRRERQLLPEAFGKHTQTYFERIETLMEHLVNGRLHAAKALCKLDFEAG